MLESTVTYGGSMSTFSCLIYQYMEKILSLSTLPDKINNQTELEELLSRPSQAVIDDLSKLEGDIIILGAGGQVGPSLATMAKRAAPHKRIVAVSRFTNQKTRETLESNGVETIVCNMLEDGALEKLPKLPNVIYMAAKKHYNLFEMQYVKESQEPFMWVTNTYLPALVAQAFSNSSIVAFSSSGVYPLVPVTGEGLDENAKTEPVGEYYNSCVGRERIFQFFSQKFDTPGRLIRLNYGVSLDYSVLFDTGSRVRDKTPIPLETSHANVIWQGDVCCHILRTLLNCTTPTTPLNIGSPDLTSVRYLAHEFAKRLGNDPIFEDNEGTVDLVNSTAVAQSLYGEPIVPLSKMIDWVAHWVMIKQESLV